MCVCVCGQSKDNLSCPNSNFISFNSTKRHMEIHEYVDFLKEYFILFLWQHYTILFKCVLKYL